MGYLKDSFVLSNLSKLLGEALDAAGGGIQ